jgi:hypothetical protein
MPADKNQVAEFMDANLKQDNFTDTILSSG